VRVLDVMSDERADGMMLSANIQEPGQVRVALASTHPLTEMGTVLRVRVQVSDATVPRAWPAWAQVNEGALPVQLVKGMRPSRIYLPMVTR